MRNLTLFALLLASALPSHAGNHVSVPKLESAVANLRQEDDAQAAGKLYKLLLTERLSSSRLTRLQSELPGQQSRIALLAVADQSAFLPLPAADIPASPPPDPAAQKAILAKAADHIEKTIPSFPNFIATQHTLRFSNGPRPADWPSSRKSDREAVYFDGQSTASVSFTTSAGELTTSPANARGQLDPQARLAVEGVFGPIFNVVRKDILPSTPTWSHWETGHQGPMAVFHFAVPGEKSHYLVQGARSNGSEAFSAYQGEIAIDPATGALLRITMQAVLNPNVPVAAADLAVEYGPVEVDGRSYICPLRSASISRVRDLDPFAGMQPSAPGPEAHYRLGVNDVTFGDYHHFGSELRILPDEADKPHDPADSDPATPPPSPAPPKP